MLLEISGYSTFVFINLGYATYQTI